MKRGKNVIAMLLATLTMVTSIGTMAYAASSSYSFTMNYRLVDGKSQGLYHTLNAGDVNISGTHYETSTDPGALSTYNKIYYALYRDCVGPDHFCGSRNFSISTNPSGYLGSADTNSSKYYLQIYKVEDDGHNIAGSGTIYN